MISYIEGKIIHRDLNLVILNVGGVGYKVFVPSDISADLANKKDKTVALWTHQAVREDTLDLYGFLDRESLEFFELLLTVSGIGPKSAMTIINVAPVKTLRSAIASGDPSHLSKTTGIGTKKAEKIILELRDKLDISDSEIHSYRGESDVIDALKALGYTEKDARDTVKKLPSAENSTQEKIKLALKNLGR